MKRILILACLPVGMLLESCNRYVQDPYVPGRYRKERDTEISIPIGVKKKKKAIQPSMAFIESVKRYRETHHHFPHDLWNLENDNDYSRNAFRSMKEMGFTSLTLDYIYLDSMVVGFRHAPVYKQKISTYEGLGRPVTGKFIFSYNRDSSSFLYEKIID